MQTTLNRPWWQEARMPGVLRYHQKAMGSVVIDVLVIVLVSYLIAFIAPLMTDIHYSSGDISADIGSTIVVGFILAMITAHKSTRFLLRFGTARLSVWLGNVLSLFVAMLVFLLGTLMLSMLMNALTRWMVGVIPGSYSLEQSFGDNGVIATYADSLLAALKALPSNILTALEWTTIFYLLACCLRRNRGITIAIVVGVPMMLMILTLIPAVRQAVQVVENGNEGQMTLLGLQWMKYLTDVMQFIRREWPTIQLLAALGSLPLSYLCMRETPQP